MRQSRLLRAELSIMEAELHLDGMNTHIRRMGKNCALDGTPFQKKIASSLGAVRSARELLRGEMGAKQRTITTRGSKNNTYTGDDGKPLWDAQYRRPDWECGFDIPKSKSPEKGLLAACWFCKHTFKKAKECKECRLFVCPNCGKCGCSLTPEAREAVWITLNAVFRTDYWAGLIESHAIATRAAAMNLPPFGVKPYSEERR